MEINSYNNLLSSPSPLLIKARKLLPKLASMAKVCLCDYSCFLWVYVIFLCVSYQLRLFCLDACAVSASLPLISLICGNDFTLFLSLCSCMCVVQDHVENLGLKLWVITPIMNHHALFGLSSPRGIDCIMKISFSLSNTLSLHNSFHQ